MAVGTPPVCRNTGGPARRCTVVDGSDNKTYFRHIKISISISLSIHVKTPKSETNQGSGGPVLCNVNFLSMKYVERDS